MKTKVLLFLVLAASFVHSAMAAWETIYTYKGDEWIGQQSCSSENPVIANTNDCPVGWSLDGVYYVSDAGGIQDPLTKADLQNTSSYQECTAYTLSGDGTLSIPNSGKFSYFVVRYEPWTYSIVFNGNGQTDGTMSNKTGVSYTNTMTLAASAYSRTGYRFGGWTSSTGKTFADKATVDGEKFGVTKDGETVTLTAKWTAKTYNVSYNENGGTAGSSRPTTATYDKAFLVSAPKKDGYNFKGWTLSFVCSTAKYGSSEAKCTSTVQSSVVSTTGDIYFKNLTGAAGETITLTAKWTAKTYNVSYDENGGTAGSSRPTTATYDKAFLVSAPTRTGYVFNGWKLTGNDSHARYGTSESACETSISGGQVSKTGNLYFKNLTAAAGSTVKLTAQWTAKTYNVSYNEDGGTAGSSRPTSATYDATTFLVSAPTKTGYVFKGWLLSGYNSSTARYGTSASACTSSIPSSGLVSTTGTVYFKNLTDVASGAVNFTAQWEKIVTTVTFSPEGATSATPEKSIEYGQTPEGFASVTLPVRGSSYNFQGYYTKQNGQGVQYFNSEGRLVKTWDIPSTTVTLYAYWTESNYIISFDANGGKGTIADQTVAYSKTFTFPSGSALTPADSAHAFGGWALSKGASAAAYKGGETTSVKDIASKISVTESKLTFYAFWTDLSRRISVNANGGTVSSNSFTTVIGQTYGSRGPLPTATWKDYKKAFAGWFTASSGGTAVTPSTVVSESSASTLYAQWTNTWYKIRFDGNGQTDGAMSDKDVAFNVSTPLTASAYSRTGYAFSGWATTADATKAAYADGASVLDLATSAGATVDLYAVWSANTYYVAFDANGGSGTMPTLTNAYGVAFTIPANKFTQDASKFLAFDHWLDEATGKKYAEGTTVSNLTITANATVTLKAVWKSSLSDLSTAMHCETMNWETTNGVWEAYNRAGVGYGSDSCACATNVATMFAIMSVTNVTAEPKIVFWWKPSSAKAKLQIGHIRDTEGLPSTVDGTDVVANGTTEWQKVTYAITEKDGMGSEYTISIVRPWTNGDGAYDYIDQMRWVSAGSYPEPTADDAVTPSSFATTDGGWVLSFTGSESFAYRVLYTDSLSSPNWQVYSDAAEQVGTGAAQSFTISRDADRPMRFFKIETIQRQ